MVRLFKPWYLNTVPSNEFNLNTNKRSWIQPWWLSGLVRLISNFRPGWNLMSSTWELSVNRVDLQAPTLADPLAVLQLDNPLYFTDSHLKPVTRPFVLLHLSPKNIIFLVVSNYSATQVFVNLKSNSALFYNKGHVFSRP